MGTNNNQANDDSWTISEQLFLGDFFFDVLANDTHKKPLHSIDDGQVGDLGSADLARSAAASGDRSALGATIWITSDGRIGYSAQSIKSLIDQLGEGETVTDSFLYAVRQGSNVIWATARITITGTNDAPVAIADVAAVDEDALATGSVAANDHDVDHGAMLTYSQIGATPGFALASDGSWAFDGSDLAYQQLAAGETRQMETFYSVTDEHGARSVSTLSLTVTGANDAPVAVSSQVNGTMAPWPQATVLTGNVSASDADDGAVLSYALEGHGPPEFTMAADGQWSFRLTSFEWLTLAEGQSTAGQFLYRATDEHGASSIGVLEITINGTNDAPISEAAFAVASEDSVTSGSYASFDLDQGAILTYSLYSQYPATYVPGFSIGPDGTWSLDGSIAEFQSLAEGQSISLVLHIVATDEHGLSDINELTIEVAGRNDGPVTTSSAAEVAEGESVSGQLFALDQDQGAQLTFALDGDAPAGFSFAADGHWGFDASDEAYAQLAAGEIQIVEVPFTVTDEHGAAASSFLIIAVTGTGGATVIGGQTSGTVIEARPGSNGTLAAQGQLTVDDPDGPDSFIPVSYQDTASNYGMFSISSSGAWQYVLNNANSTVDALNLGQTLADSFTVYSADGTAQSISILIQGATDWSAPAVYTGSGDPNDRDNLVGAGVSDNSPTIIGGDDNNVITGGPANQTIDALGGSDIVYAGAGNDTVYGGGGGDSIMGQAGADILYSGWGSDSLYGGSGNDILRAQDATAEAQFGTWPVTMYGGSGSDVLVGGNNNDFLIGGYGADTMTGGGNRDAFIFNSLNDSGDRITDFLYAVDTLDFRALDANAAVAGDQAFLWSQNGAAANSLWAIQQGADTIIYGDADGNANTAEFMLTLQNVFVPATSNPSGFLI